MKQILSLFFIQSISVQLIINIYHNLSFPHDFVQISLKESLFHILCFKFKEYLFLHKIAKHLVTMKGEQPLLITLLDPYWLVSCEKGSPIGSKIPPPFSQTKSFVKFCGKFFHIILSFSFNWNEKTIWILKSDNF